MKNEIIQAFKDIKTISIKELINIFNDNVESRLYKTYAITRDIIMEDIECQ